MCTTNAWRTGSARWLGRIVFCIFISIPYFSWQWKHFPGSLCFHASWACIDIHVLYGSPICNIEVYILLYSILSLTIFICMCNGMQIYSHTRSVSAKHVFRINDASSLLVPHSSAISYSVLFFLSFLFIMHVLWNDTLIIWLINPRFESR